MTGSFSAHPVRISGKWGMVMKRVVSTEGITKKNAPYLMIWVLYYAWVVIFTTWWTVTPSSGDIYTADIRSIVHGVNLLSSAVCISFYKKEWFAKAARAAAVILLAGTTVFLFVLPTGWQLYAAPAVGAILGLMNVSILIPFVYVMNNTEKLYGMLLAFVCLNLLSLLGQTAWFGSLGEKIASLVILAAALSGVLFFKKEDLNTPDALLPAKPANKTVYFSLAINCFFAVFIKGVGIIMLNNISGVNLPSAYLCFFTGGLLGCGVYWFVFARVRGSLFTVWNITFSAFLLAALSYAVVPVYPAAGIPVAIFTGIAGTIGMITLYYNTGVIGRKYRSMNYLKLCLWFGVLGGGGSVVLGNLLGRLNQTVAITVLAGVSVLACIVYFIMFPFLQRTYFQDEWTTDSELTETDGQLGEMMRRYQLTPRESQICRLLLDGHTMRQIAGELQISQSTVSMHTVNLYRKLGINSRIELLNRMRETL